MGAKARARFTLSKVSFRTFIFSRMGLERT